MHAPADGAWNMAVDEALLESCAAADGAAPPPTLRLYGWRPPAVSLGRGQPLPPSCDPGRLRAEGLDLVRRPTGGAAVLHDAERTYAVIARLGEPPFRGGVVETYRRIAEALAAGLARLGLEVELATPPASSRRRRPVSCFDLASVHEITLQGVKLVGSAQARRRRAFLQHGSIPLRGVPERVAALLGPVEDPRRHGDLQRVLRRSIVPAELDRALVEGFRQSLGAELRPGQLTAPEAERATRLRCWKYDSGAWTLDGRYGRRERRWGPP